jgi:hypothetical protein
VKTTPPIAPDPAVYWILGAVCSSGVAIASAWRGDVWLYTLMAALFVAGGFAILYLTGVRNYKRELEAWRLRDRAQLPVSQLDPGSVYTIDGVLSTRTASGGWLEIGSGVATFHFKPDRQTIALPPRDYKLTEWRRRLQAEGKLEGELKDYAGWDEINRNLEAGAEARRQKKQTPPTREG